MTVRYADDFVMGFESKADAQEMLLALKARLASFGLTLHEDKTRLIEFGRFAALSRQRRGERRPETFAFLGFTHYCGRTRDGRFIVKHKTEGKRLTRKLTALRQDAWRLMHAPLATQHGWFAAVLRGHYGYHGRPAQLSSAQRLLPRSASDLAALSETAQPEKSAHGLVRVRDPDGTLPPANSVATDSPYSGATAHTKDNGAIELKRRFPMLQIRIYDAAPNRGTASRRNFSSQSAAARPVASGSREQGADRPSRTARLGSPLCRLRSGAGRSLGLNAAGGPAAECVPSGGGDAPLDPLNFPGFAAPHCTASGGVLRPDIVFYG
ncbi:reverse transcriptase domain-containing protein [Bradyrhizobium sp. USDA 10063]